MTVRLGPRRCCVLGAILGVFSDHPAWAVDPFEIQVYDGTANAAQHFGLEVHANAVVRGLAGPLSARLATSPELPQNHQLHFTLEPSYGVFSWWELGAYVQTAVADGSYDFAGVKVRSKFVTPPGWHPHMRLGLNVEVSCLPNLFDRNVWAMELRPIVAWEDDHMVLAINPIVGIPLGGLDSVTFEPAALAVYKVERRVSLGFEYYGSFGGAQIHYLYEVVNVLAVDRFELNIGFGEGLTEASNRFVAKTIVGYTF
jgi:hypothetical protein